MHQFWRFEGRKRPFFTLYPAIPASFRFSKCVRFGPFKKCCRVPFRILDEKQNQKRVSHRANPKFSVRPFLDFVTLNDLDLEYAHRKLWMILGSVPDTIHVVILTYFHSIRLQSAIKPDSKLSNILALTWPVTSSVTPRSINLGFPRQILQIYRRRLNFVNPTSSS